MFLTRYVVISISVTSWWAFYPSVGCVENSTETLLSIHDQEPLLTTTPEYLKYILGQLSN